LPARGFASKMVGRARAIPPGQNLEGTMTTTEENDATTFDEARAEAFAERFLGALNESSLVVMLSVGHRTGLFDAMDGLDWSTSGEIAKAARLDERYVREWLGAMVSSRVVEYRPEAKTYLLPAEHARWLTRKASPENLAVTSQWLSVIGAVESEIVECFKSGGGVPYEAYHRFHETMAEESAQTVVAALHDHILPLSPGLAAQLEEGIRVLDVGCGSGRAACALAEAYPKSTFTGYDLCEEAVVAANAHATAEGLTNATFRTHDITHLEEPGAYDLVTAFDIVHDQKDPETVLANVHSVLKPGGTFLMQDIAGSSHLEKNLDHPIGAFGYTISTMHCMTVSLAQGGAGLGTMWGEELAEEMLKEAGFTDLEKHKLEHDFINVYYVMSRP
jgi:2-polyprenyl-3-methyl-5-hydroxy-6-metoxy-1,4-benzoquinol methylase